MRYIALLIVALTVNLRAAEKDARETAIFAGGCFWGTEYFMALEPGVVSVVSGYTGGDKRLPNYRDVSSGKSGHAEAVKVVFDPTKVSYERLARKFFMIHDPTEPIRRAKDQYRSAIFYRSSEQKTVAQKLINQLKENGYDIKTQVSRAGTFWKAETDHQNYYSRIGVSPRCHKYRDRFKSSSEK